MKPPRLLAEVPAGLGSVSLVLQGGRHCKPPVSRMGNKHGYALPILDAMGLRPGQGAESYLWTEADPDVRALLCAYTQPDLLRAVAEVLRGWVDEEPRALWTRLRDERRARKAALPSDQSVAEWLWFIGHSNPHQSDVAPPYQPGAASRATWKPPPADWLPRRVDRLSRGPGWPPVAVTATAPSAEEVAGWLALQTHTLKTGGFAAEHVGSPGSRRPAELPVGRVGELASIPWPPTLVTAQAPSAEQVAGWVVSAGWAAHGKDLDHFGGPGRFRENGGETAITVGGLQRRIEALADVSTRPTAPTPGADLEGCVIYMDPPYVGTTGYGADLPRAEVIRLATEYAAAGALVVVSEAVAIPELTALGWDAVNIGGERRGQRRTFGATEEWITMSRPPVNRPATQGALFAMGGS